ncbi:FliA/WhiG family RNA polymerase sigma factor [Gracilibacillus alcaliphilus]|uniref:FliA/WhiG family RNA polymerase sigma factor n=1 Tax=Gracilibacillus alcaliphilus TaxID=1401441 RepID=UPI00195A499C|nr:FliA/WhiG family RNA polymerase sigma factor [Gracilibacillus alcaliphilus]MBM7677959.1 RNA polymerase sigma factor for flagellar operon FliA [Gracilibacillus alcaliphilus]
MVKEAASEQILWENWLTKKREEDANQLIEYYMYLVNYHVQRITANLPRNVNKDDIRSLGMTGLYDALLKFDHTRELKFDTYASFRIKGAIIDGLRKEDWLPRTTRDRVKKVEQTIELLEQQLQHEVTTAEIANHMQISTDEVEEIMKDSFFSNLLSIEEKSKLATDETREAIGYLIPDDREPKPENHLLKQESYQTLADCMKQLNENEQLVLDLFYDKELTFTEIGKVLQLTTSRISQIHKQAITKIRRLFAHYQ